MNKIETIFFYLRTIKETDSKLEIYKYLIKRIFGTRKEFDKDVLLYKKNGLVFNCGKTIQNCIIVAEEFEDEITECLKVGSKGTFIDIGAHIGKFSIIASSLGYNVLSIEANPENFRLLNNNKEINNCKDMKTNNIICSDKEGVKDFEVNPFYPAGGKVTEEIDIEDAIMFKYKCNSLDNLAKDINDLKIIKVDVEEHELKVLEGGVNIIEKFKPKIIFEAWDNKAKVEIEKFLSTFGYKIKKIGDVNYLAEVETAKYKSVTIKE